jgi:hypothetical protein
MHRPPALVAMCHRPGLVPTAGAGHLAEPASGVDFFYFLFYYNMIFKKITFGFKILQFYTSAAD